MQANQFDFRAHLALMGVNLFYGINYVVAKEATPEYISAFSLVGMRVIGACLLFNIFYYSFLKGEKIDKADFPRLLFCAFFGTTANVALFIKGLSLTSPINASLIMITVPILVLIFSAIFLKEKLNNWKILGVIIGAVGAALLVIRTSQTAGEASLLGDLCIFGNALSYSIYLVAVKPIMKKYQPLTVLRLFFTLGMLMLLPLYFPAFLEQSFEGIPFNAWLATGFVIIFATFFTYLLNVFAIKRVQPSVVSIYIYTQPAIASFIAVLSGKYSLQWEHIIASIFIFIGVSLISK